MQENQDHDQHQDARLEQRGVDLVDGSFDKYRGIQRNIVAQTFGEPGGGSRQLIRNRFGGVQSIGPRQLINRNATGGLAVVAKFLGVALASQFNPGHIAQAHNRSIGRRTDDQFTKILGGRQGAVYRHRELQILTLGYRGGANLSGADTLVLLGQDVDDLAGHKAALAHLRCVEPYAHGVLAHPKYIHVCHAGYAHQAVAQLQAGEVA